MISYQFHLNAGVSDYKNYSKHLRPLDIESTFLEQKWSTVLIEVEDAQVLFTADGNGFNVEFITESMSIKRAQEIMEAIRRNLRFESEWASLLFEEQIAKSRPIGWEAEERRKCEEEKQKAEQQRQRAEQQIKERQAIEEADRRQQAERLELRKKAEEYFQNQQLSQKAREKAMHRNHHIYQGKCLRCGRSRIVLAYHPELPCP